MFFVVLMWHSLSCSWYIYLFQFSFINFPQKNVKKKNVTNEQNQRGSRSQVYNYVLPYT